MACRLIAYTSNPPTPEEDLIVTRLAEHFDVMVDSQNTANPTWIEYQFKDTQHRYYINDYDIHSVHECDATDGVQFAIYFANDAVLPKYTWNAIMLKLNNIIYDSAIASYSEKLFKEVNVRAVKPEQKDMQVDAKLVQNPEYQFFQRAFEDRDVMLVEITKPFTPCPYVIVIREFKTKGYLPLFSGLFVSPSWNVSRNDVPFLERVWKFLDMEGDFDMDKILKEATEKCFPGVGRVPEAEPELYRDTLDNVLITLQNKANGIKRQRV
jgi:hypothetical protein